jgi:hypothetical protein
MLDAAADHRGHLAPLRRGVHPVRADLLLHWNTQLSAIAALAAPGIAISERARI